MINSPPNQTQRRTARWAGFLYLLQMASGVFGFFLHGRLVVETDAAQTAKNILASPGLFRLGTISDVITTLLVITLAWTLYVVLKPVNENVALLGLALRLAENAIAAAAVFMDFLALRLISGTEYVRGFDTTQLQVLARLFIGGQPTGLQIAFVFLGFGTATLTYLWWKSRYIPRVIAAWGIFSSLLLAIMSIVVMLFPPVGNALGLSYMMPMGVYEVGLGLWLLIRGIRMPVAQEAIG